MSALQVERRGERGQALVEFALVAPIFFLMLFGIIQLGLLFADQNGLVNGVREAARLAAPYRVVDSTGAATACSAVQSQLTNSLKAGIIGFDSNNLTPTITYTWNHNVDYITVTVKADYKFPLTVPLIANIIDGIDGVTDNKLKMTAREEMRVENDPQTISADSTVTC